MAETQSKLQAHLLSATAIGLVLLVDLFLFNRQSSVVLLPHFAIAMFTAQLGALLVFYKGEICPGQRGRLVKSNLYLALYWSAWLGISLFYPASTLIKVMSLCGLSATYVVWKQPREEKTRHSFLLMATLVSFLGIMSQLVGLNALDFNKLPLYNPISQLIAGVLLMHLMLVIARSRLQGLIALLPLAVIVLLALNACASCVFLAFNGAESAVNSEAVFAYLIYFLCHIVIAALLLIHSFQKWTLKANTLLILLFIALSLPVWMQFI